MCFHCNSHLCDVTSHRCRVRGEKGCRIIGSKTETGMGTGTERCQEAVTKLPLRYDIVINIQGDEPLMEPENIDAVVRALQDSPDAVYRFDPPAGPMRCVSVLFPLRSLPCLSSESFLPFSCVLPHGKAFSIPSTALLRSCTSIEVFPPVPRLPPHHHVKAFQSCNCAVFCSCPLEAV